MPSHVCALFVAWSIFAVSPAFSQSNSPAPNDGAELAELYNQGMGEFAAGDYAKAAADPGVCVKRLYNLLSQRHQGWPYRGS